MQTVCVRYDDLTSMELSGMDWPDYLRDQAAMYRKLAEQTDDPVVKNELVCTENLNPNVLTMKSAQYGARNYDAGSLNLARDRRILVQ